MSREVDLKQDFKVCALTADMASQLEGLFDKIKLDTLVKYFHPHSFTKAKALTIAYNRGADMYFGAYLKTNLVGYGFLRGWDEGYTIPSIGIYLLKEVRGLGLSSVFMKDLHHRAREKGASSIRLKVYPENKVAINLYSKLGYVFETSEEGQLVGFVHI